MLFPTKTALAALILALPGAALAHPKLVSATPAANATVAPTNSVKLTFSEGLMPNLSSGTLMMTGMPGMANHAEMKVAATSAVSPDGKSLTLTTAKPLPAGSYRADYAIVSVDTHRVTGKHSFSVK